MDSQPRSAPILIPDHDSGNVFINAVAQEIYKPIHGLWRMRCNPGNRSMYMYIHVCGHPGVYMQAIATIGSAE